MVSAETMLVIDRAKRLYVDHLQAELESDTRIGSLLSSQNWRVLPG